MKRFLGVAVVVAALGAIPASHALWGKGHVPLGKVQACHKGQTITVAEESLDAHLGHGDCQLPACDFANIFQTRDPCSGVLGQQGRCDVPNERVPADGVTPACPAGTF